jgi:hypothetical protein
MEHQRQPEVTYLGSMTDGEPSHTCKTAVGGCATAVAAPPIVPPWTRGDFRGVLGVLEQKRTLP